MSCLHVKSSFISTTIGIREIGHSTSHLVIFARTIQLCPDISCRLMETAKEMVAESLPIKCLEAVLLGAYPLSCVSYYCILLNSVVVADGMWNNRFGPCS